MSNQKASKRIEEQKTLIWPQKWIVINIQIYDSNHGNVFFIMLCNALQILVKQNVLIFSCHILRSCKRILFISSLVFSLFIMHNIFYSCIHIIIYKEFISDEFELKMLMVFARMISISQNKLDNSQVSTF